MAYTIYNTDGTTLLLLADNTVDQSATSLSLVGKNVNGYGQYMNNNFVKLLANSASSAGTPPRSPLTGQLWFDTTARRLKIYDGSFKPVTGASVSGIAPANPVSGDLWFDSINSQLNTYNGGSWSLVGPAFQARVGENGWTIPPGAIQDSYLNTQQVTLMKNYGQILGLISTATFTTTNFSSATTLLSSNSLDVVRGLTVFGSIQATRNLRVYNTFTTNGISSIEINNSGLITTKTFVTEDFSSTGSASFNGTASSISTSTGALVVKGGAGIGGDLYVGGKVVAQQLEIQYTTVTSVSIKTDDVFTTYNSTQATSTTTGAIVVTGGVGVGKNLYVGGTANINSLVVASSVGAAMDMGGYNITNMADPVLFQDAVTKKYLYSRNIVLSIDVSDGLDNAGIIAYLTQIAPTTEYTTGTIARILCSTITNNTATVSLLSSFTLTTGSFLTSTSTSDVALTGFTGTNPTVTPTVSVSRVVKTFTIASNVWTFVS